MRKLLAFVFINASLLATTNYGAIQCPYCECYILLEQSINPCSVEEVQRAVWGDTWTCPKKTCGYENYEGIDYCGMCGTKRP